MAKKVKSVYVCQNCGQKYVKWQGQCTNCNQWNTLVEELDIPTKPSLHSSLTKGATPKKLTDIQTSGERRFLTIDEEMNRILGCVVSYLVLCGVVLAICWAQLSY